MILLGNDLVCDYFVVIFCYEIILLNNKTIILNLIFNSNILMYQNVQDWKVFFFSLIVLKKIENIFKVQISYVRKMDEEKEKE